MKKFLIGVVAIGFLLMTSQKVEGLWATDSGQLNAATVQERLREMQALREQKITEVQQRVGERKEEWQEQMLTIREEFQQRLQGIKDVRKKKIVENLDAAYVRINKRWTTHFLNVLERLEKILDKLKLRAEKLEKTAVLTKIDQAYLLITATKTKVETQAAKVYTIEITDEESLREAAQAVHEQLKSDLKVLREEVKKTREAVHEIFQLMAQEEKLNSLTEGAE